MQTFLPYADFTLTARTLDNRRLGKQRVEGMQILNIISKADYAGGWTNHPAVNMWRGYDSALKLYINEMIREWQRRGFRNTMQIYEVDPEQVIYPWWLGNPRLHESHRSNLLRKEPDYYRQFGWEIGDDLPYFWPVPSMRTTLAQINENDRERAPEFGKIALLTDHTTEDHSTVDTPGGPPLL